MLSFSKGGGATAAVVALDTAFDDSRKEKAKGIARYPDRLSSRDGYKYYYHLLEYDLRFPPSSLPSFVLTCLFLGFHRPPRRLRAGIFPSFVLLRPWSRYVFLFSMYIFLLVALRHLLVLCFFSEFRYALSCVFVFFRFSFCCYVLVTVTLAFHLLYPEMIGYCFCVWHFSVSQSVTTQLVDP